MKNITKLARDLEQMREWSKTNKQETLEEAAANLADPSLCKTDNWIAGAKWQQERMYSEEDMIHFNEWVTIMYPNQRKLLTTSDKRGFYTTKELLIKWFEQFKKK